MFKIKNFISPTIKFPYNMVRGTVDDRNFKAAHYAEEFSKLLDSRCQNGKCTVDDFKNILDFTMFPHKVNYKILPEQNPNYSGSFVNEFQFKKTGKDNFVVNHIGYKISVKQDDVGKISKYTALHETRHMFDSIFNPKYNIYRNGKLLNNVKLIDTAAELKNILSAKVDMPMNEVKQKSDKLLKQLTPEIAVDLLQKLRYCLKSEHNAYNQVVKYFLENRKLKDAFNLKIHLIKNIHIKSKIKYAEKELAKYLKLCRNSD